MLGRKNGFSHQGSCLVWRRGQELSQGSQDVGIICAWDAATVCAQEPRVYVPGMLCFVPRDWGPVQGWCPHPQSRKRQFWLCHEDHFGQRSRGSCATPWSGKPDSPHQELQAEDGTLQHKANTHSP